MLTVIGAKAYSLLYTLLAQDESYNELRLKSHLNPQPIMIAEHFQFYCHSQHGSEPMAKFVTDDFP